MAEPAAAMEYRRVTPSSAGGYAAGSSSAEPSGSDQPRYAQAAPAEGEERTAHDGREGPLLIYTANISLAVHQVADKQSRVEAIAREAGGYLHHRGDMEITNPRAGRGLPAGSRADP